MIAFAGDSDPLEAASAAARDLLRTAQTADVLGPPVDIFGLARALAIELRPSAEGWDASLHSRSGQFVVEYDPTRPKGRLRFSIAHEIAHTCFADAGESIRHRTAQGAVPDPQGDSWEVELLCNLIAAEILMPTESIQGHLNSDFDIDFLMELRRRWDVSTEAILRKYVTDSGREGVLIATSRVDGEARSIFRVDYAQNPPSISGMLGTLFHHGQILDQPNLLNTCVAVGQTVRGTMIQGGVRLSVQAVGVPPYPGSTLPRVLAYIQSEEEYESDRGIIHVVGDILDIDQASGPALVAHIVSDEVRQWSNWGVAGALRRAFPDAAGSFRAWTIFSPEHLRLGRVHLISRYRNHQLIEIASIVAQAGYGSSFDSRLDLEAMSVGLDVVASRAIELDATVHVPRLGAGQAGGRWDHVERLLAERLASKGVEVVVHTLPSRTPEQWGNDHA